MLKACPSDCLIIDTVRKNCPSHRYTEYTRSTLLPASELVAYYVSKGNTGVKREHRKRSGATVDKMCAMTPCPSAGGADCNKAGETLGVLPAPWRPGRWFSRPHRSSVKVPAACTPGPVTGPPRATRALGGIAALGSCAAAAACGDVAATEDCACSRPSGGLKAAEPQVEA